MCLTNKQKQLIIDNYGAITSPVKLSIIARCSINEVKNFTKKKGIMYFINNKTRVPQPTIEINNWVEPELSTEELTMLNNSLNLKVDAVDSHVEIINEKRFKIFQSRLNYDEK